MFGGLFRAFGKKRTSIAITLFLGRANFFKNGLCCEKNEQTLIEVYKNLKHVQKKSGGIGVLTQTSDVRTSFIENRQYTKENRWGLESLKREGTCDRKVTKI